MVEGMRAATVMTSALRTAIQRSDGLLANAQSIHQITKQAFLKLNQSQAFAPLVLRNLEGELKELICILQTCESAVSKLSNRLFSLILLPFPDQMDALAKAVVDTLEETALQLDKPTPLLRAADMKVFAIKYIDESINVATHLYNKLYEPPVSPLLLQSLKKYLTVSMMKLDKQSLFSQSELLQLIQERMAVSASSA